MSFYLLLSSLFLFDPLATESGDGTQNLQTLQGKISAVNEDLHRLEEKLAEMKRHRQRLAGEIGQLELQRAVISRSIEKHELELQEAEQQLSLNGEKRDELKARARKQQQALGKRLRELYKRGALGYAQIFLKQSRLSDLINAYHYAKILTDRDHRALREYRDTVAQLEVVANVLEKIKTDAQESKTQLAERQHELSALLETRNGRLREIRRETADNNRLLKDLELEKEELVLMVRRLTEDDADPLELRVPIHRYKGKLEWPAEGRIRRKFGIYKDPEFSTKRKQNGIDIAIPKGREIRAVYSGKVIYADWFKSYGNLVIIDHGEKVISFYAHCDRLLVAKGEIVEREVPIALSGDTGSLEGPLLHFEIRKQTQPEDPLHWLKKR